MECKKKGETDAFKRGAEVAVPNLIRTYLEKAQKEETSKTVTVLGGCGNEISKMTSDLFRSVRF